MKVPEHVGFDDIEPCSLGLLQQIVPHSNGASHLMCQSESVSSQQDAVRPSGIMNRSADEQLSLSVDHHRTAIISDIVRVC